MSDPSADEEYFSILSESKIYRDYANAFVKGTGLHLRLVPPAMVAGFEDTNPKQNVFCALISASSSNKCCEACRQLQFKIEAEAQAQARTLTCFAGLCESAVPVRVGAKVIAFLKTGQVFRHSATKKKFKKVAAKLIKWGAQVDLQQAEDAFFNSRVLTKIQYESLIHLLCIFAEHLAASASALQLERTRNDIPCVGVARAYIQNHVEDDLSLNTVAKVVNLSASYFSQKFRQATGLNFTEYVSRTRIEKARNLLQNPHLRVSEIAFAVGFESLSQFNRAFKKVAGHSPTEHRRSHLR